MFNQEELEQEVNEEFSSLAMTLYDNLIEGAFGVNCVSDPIMEQSGPRLQGEYDMQEWQSLLTSSFPGEEKRYENVNCLRVKRVSNGRGRFYFRVQYGERWSQDDLAEMSQSPVKEVAVRKAPPSEEPNTPALDDDVKTRIQITLKKNSKNVCGSTGNFVVRRVKANALYDLLKVLLETYPKIKESRQVVRVQFTEYRADGGNYRKECGANLNLHNADVNPIVSFIHSVIAKYGWDYTSTVGERSVETKIDNAPAAMEYYDKERHSGLWCLCKIHDGKSLVLETAGDVSPIAMKHFSQGEFTYIINPKGGVLKLKSEA